MQGLRSYGRSFVVAKLLDPNRLGDTLRDVVKDFADLTEAKINKGVRIAAIKTFTGIVKMTPVGNPDLWLYNHPTKGYIDYIGYHGYPTGYVGGRARNNWFIGAAKGDETTKETSNKGTGYINKGMPKKPLNSSVVFYNNLPYIIPLEFGHSTQAPKGMVRLNILKWRKNLKSALKAVK